MEIPQHWVRVDGWSSHLGRSGGRLSVWGWSTESHEDAERVGRERLADTLARVEREGRLPDTRGYYPRTPLREPILEEVHGEGGGLIGVLTRNRMGCEVLCTDALFIADVDVPELAEDRATAAGRRPARRRGGVSGFLRSMFLGRPGPIPMAPGSADAAGLDAPPSVGRGTGYEAYPAGGADRVRVAATGPEAPSVAECLACEPAWEFARRHPDLGVRVYRTAAGLRVVVTGLDAPPGSEEGRRVLTELRSDPLYVELCSTHGSYRARLTPKPFRVGLTSLAVPWPCGDSAAERAWLGWVDRYDDASQGSSVCRLVSASGPVPSADEQRLVELHDERAGVGDRLLLA